MTTSCGVSQRKLKAKESTRATPTLQGQGDTRVGSQFIQVPDKGVTYKEPFMGFLTAISVVSVQTLHAGVSTLKEEMGDLVQGFIYEYVPKNVVTTAFEILVLPFLFLLKRGSTAGAAT